MFTIPFQLDKANTDDEIDTIVDKPSTMMIINRSRWRAIEPINKSNKGALLQQLILEEVFIRREAYILAFKRGMAVSDLIRDYPALMRPLLVAEDSVFTSDDFMSLIGSLKPSEPIQLLSFERFED